MAHPTLDLARQTPLIGVVLKMPGPAWIELAGYCGVDLIILDTEHGAGDDAELEHHLRAADAVGVPVLVRVPANDPAHIQSALDAGATGVVVPHIESRADAERAVAAAHYPPRGNRGLALTTRAGDQGGVDLEDHLRRSARDTVVVAQIEDLQGAAVIDDIVQISGLSAVWIGLNDLSMSVRGADDAAAASEEVSRAQEVVCQSARDSGTALLMIAPDEARARYWRQRGATVLLATGHDLFRGALTAYHAIVSSVDVSS